MAQRRHHYERAFEAYLRARRIPYISVDEARKALLPDGSPLRATPILPPGAPSLSLKSFDFVIYAQPGQRGRPGANLLVEVKGRRAPALRSASSGALRLESWVTEDDVAGLARWQALFGVEFDAAFVFLYWCDLQPPDALFDEVFEDRGRWYALRAIRLRDYAAHLRPRSARWRTVHLASEDFDRFSGPLWTSASPSPAFSDPPRASVYC